MISISPLNSLWIYYYIFYQFKSLYTNIEEKWHFSDFKNGELNLLYILFDHMILKGFVENMEVE